MKTTQTDFAFLHGGNMAYLESLYRDGGDNGEWREVFRALENGGIGEAAAIYAPAGDARAAFQPSIHKQAQVSRLISAYRAFGHLLADIDPIGVMPRGDAGEIELRAFGLGEADLAAEFDLGNLGRGGRKPLRDILAYLRAVYCGPIGYEISHLTSGEQRDWLRARVESEPVRPALGFDERLELLQKLTAADGLEKYLHTKYTGQKRFSLEGGDVLIPMLSDMIRQFGAAGVREIVIGMAHRGRLNVLVNILGKAPKDLFSEFEGEYQLDAGDNQTGDVKYHQGASSDIETPGGIVHLALSFNPSHLEIIDPVIEGSVRARQERRGDSARKQVVPILMHGDAAFAGQGVVMETLNMARTRGYSVGGTIHIIVNNQIGFTTNTLDARSTLYCTEVAKMVQAPIFHVNGEDPEAARQAARLALAYRMQFGGDAIIDIVCYRRHGHNEADEPSMTQPIMYGKIKTRKTPREIYAERLIADGALNAARAAAMVEDYRAQLDAGRVVAGQVLDQNKAQNMVDWKPYLGAEWDDGTVTSVDPAAPLRLAKKLNKAPKDFVVHPRVQKVLDERVAMAAGKKPMDWGCAELLAYAAILKDGFDIRLSGQDAGRGTFSHRHVTLHDQSQARIHIPMQHLGGDARYLVINSLLSEEAVLAFEYGYATTEPRTLVIWEAQFGDFVNGAQVVIDQFISSGQAKWARVCGLTMFLPHGLEGQGPEHSSARLERFLQLSAEQNMQVCAPTTPAQMFHMLRRQILRPLRRPLVVMMPKSLLRHKLAVSAVEDLSNGKFHIVLGEADEMERGKVTRMILCSGKVYYDLLEERRRRKLAHIAIIRLEQLHPFPTRDLADEMQRYPAVTDIVWCQEEPKNQGAWYQIDHFLRTGAKPQQQVRYVGREASPSPAVGYYKLHLEQQRRLVEQALSEEST
ncbi:MAG: 2-oxoglutarate dehydrogenase E1 component [Gammaproteobacteria bacterium]